MLSLQYLIPSKLKPTPDSSVLVGLDAMMQARPRLLDSQSFSGWGFDLLWRFECIGVGRMGVRNVGEDMGGPVCRGRLNLFLKCTKDNDKGKMEEKLAPFVLSANTK